MVRQEEERRPSPEGDPDASTKVDRDRDASTEVDRDVVDFAWLAGLVRRFARRGSPGEPAAAEPAAEPASWATRVLGSRAWSVGARFVLPAVLVAVIGAIAVHDHFGGIEWGDDWALYVRQAKGLATGHVTEVFNANRYNVTHSGWTTFSPYTYPWGWPLIIAPVYRVFGLNYGALKFLEVLALGGFLVAFYAIVRRRAPLYATLAIVLLVGLSPAFVHFTDTVLSDLPFLCLVFVSLWWMDRCREEGMLEARSWRLLLLGFLIAYAFNVRREGMALLPALVALHVAVLGREALRARSAKALRAINWKKLALPYAAFGATALAFFVLLPGYLFPELPGTGWHNATRHFPFYKDWLSEEIGLKDPGAPAQLFHSATAANKALVLLLLFAAVGLLGRLVWRFEQDASLAAYLCAASYIMLVSPYQEPRYLFTITPLLGYFAYQALPSVVRLSAWNSRAVVRFAAVAPAIGLLVLVKANGDDLAHAIDYHNHYHYVVDGPAEANAKEMFAAVRERTSPDDVILFFRARAMTLYTDRRSVQGSDLDLMLPRSDWYAMQRDSAYVQTPLTDAQGAERHLTKVWENAKWVLWKAPEGLRSP